jgi:hypothetical protein
LILPMILLNVLLLTLCVFASSTFAEKRTVQIWFNRYIEDDQIDAYGDEKLDWIFFPVKAYSNKPLKREGNKLVICTYEGTLGEGKWNEKYLGAVYPFLIENSTCNDGLVKFALRRIFSEPDFTMTEIPMGIYAETFDAANHPLCFKLLSGQRPWVHFSEIPHIETNFSNEGFYGDCVVSERDHLNPATRWYLK